MIPLPPGPPLLELIIPIGIRAMVRDDRFFVLVVAVVAVTPAATTRRTVFLVGSPNCIKAPWKGIVHVLFKGETSSTCRIAAVKWDDQKVEGGIRWKRCHWGLLLQNRTSIRFKTSHNFKNFPTILASIAHTCHYPKSNPKVGIQVSNSKVKL